MYFSDHIITKSSDKRHSIKDDIHSVLRSVSTPMFLSLDGMRIDMLFVIFEVLISFRNSFFDFYSHKVVLTSDIRKNEA